VGGRRAHLPPRRRVDDDGMRRSVLIASASRLTLLRRSPTRWLTWPPSRPDG
jgi:hypothetical protein